MKNFLIAFILIFFSMGLFAQTEQDYYPIITLPIPEGIILEVGGLTTLPNGNIAASTRRGEVWIVENPYMENQTRPFFRKFASGLHEALGLAFRDGTFYLSQRGELTRLWDKNGDQVADFYQSVYAWPVSGHYHEYSYGPAITDDGYMFVSGNVAFGDQEWWRGESRVPWRGWIMRISPDGKMEPWATGMRSPCGLGLINGDLFYADNQGDWMGSGGLIHVEKGDFTGHPAGLRWSQLPESPVKLKTEELYAVIDPQFSPPGQAIKPENDTSRVIIPLFEAEEKLPAIKTPAVWLPHSVLGISTSQMIVDETSGAFGPFAGQVFIGDEGQSKIVRVFLEKVNGEYQGAAFAFREGFQSGVLRMTWGKDGSLFVGQTNRGWGSSGPDDFGLQRLVWNGKMPFEMKAVRAMPDGFEVEFTQPVDKVTASNPDNYKITGFIYKYHPVYGSPVVNDADCFLEAVQVSRDGLKARIVVDNLRENYVHEITLTGIKSYYDELPLLHSTAYYTLNQIPDGTSLNIPKRKKPVAEAISHSHQTEPATPPQPASKPTVNTAAIKRQLKMPEDWTKGPDQTVQMGTNPGLKFDKTLVTVKAGAKIKWTFNNNDDMPHNCVIVRPGEGNAVGDLAIQLGLKGINMGYIPVSSKILFHTQLMQPGASESIYFYAPEKPGDYTYVCTVPGHAQLMRGVLRVTN
ncbi:MAG: plastocyanin/azurin family copper-binding protein [Bacteroidia bacterium]|nr:plastocyanin/azurin family copper-binding protein [Bacteroidia bacterium]